jgi:hypothetical protein
MKGMSRDGRDAVSRPPALRIVPVVTRKHGEKFAKKWREESTDSGAMVEAFARTGVVRWPDGRAAQMRFHDIEDEVTERVFDELREAAVDAFVRIAGEVLARERSR